MAAQRQIFTVTPAKAGVQESRMSLVALDPGFRRDDVWAEK